MGDTLFIILAAGEGTRMKSRMPKVLHAIAGRELVAHVVAACTQVAGADIAVVIGPDRNDVAACAQSVAQDVSIHEQTERLGTAHAVRAAESAIRPQHRKVIVLFGDTPLVTPDTLANMIEVLDGGPSVAVLGFVTDDPAGYGRLITEGDELIAIREHRDASEDERKIAFCNSGVMGFAASDLVTLLGRIGNDNAKGEYYLTDAVELAREAGMRTVALEGDAQEVLGINDRVQLAEAEDIMQHRLRREAMTGGATLIDPASVHLSHDTKLGRDVVVEPNVVFAQGVTVADGAAIRAFSHLEGCHVGEDAQIGPFARLRPGADLGAGAKAGNFVEIKNANIGEGAKVNHLTYVGDADVGKDANIGAGTITCNYDGGRKHRTTIGENAFIGSNSALVAPVTIGDGAYVGSGSVITKDVKSGSLAIGRARQVEMPGWVAKRAGKDK